MRVWMVFTSRVFLLISLVLGFGVVGTGAAQTGAPYEAGECPFEATPQQECGFVIVPEDRSNPDSPLIRIATVIMRGDETLPPVIVLSGGPGEITTPSAGFIAPLFQSIVGGRTLIAFDQRGVGRSEPALSCPEWVTAQLGLLEGDPSPETSLRSNNEALIACGQRLDAEGIALSAYNSVENAADVADIIRAYGYAQADVFGISYGALLAQHVMRDHAEVVRAVVIDSVLPLDASLSVSGVDTSVSAIERLLAACADQPACAAAYPDLRGTLLDAVDFYNANPVPITITDSASGESYDTLLYGDNILASVFYFLYSTPAIPTLPEAIVAIANGDTSVAESLQSQTLSALYTLERGFQYSVMCAEDVLTLTEDDLLERYAALAPQYRGRADLEALMDYSFFDICAEWPVEPLPESVKEPLVSDLPTLLLAGEFDPVTPSGYANQVAEDLANSFTYTFPGVGHSVALADGCAVSILQQFLDDPSREPDASCIEDMGVVFRVPGAVLALEPFSSADMGITGVIPEGWQELSMGVYAESATGAVVTIQQKAPVTAVELLELLASQFGIDGFPPASSTREANGLTWSLYETTGPQGLLADVAIAERDGSTYTVILLTTSRDRATYYDGLFLPAVDALQDAL